MDISRHTIKGFFKKNEQDFNEVYSQSFRLLKHIALSILHDDMEADDVVSNTYIKALESPSCFRKGSFQAWLCSIARNLAITQKQKLSKSPLFNEEDTDIPSVDPSMDESYSLVKRLLTKEEFDILFFHLYHDLPFKDIASINGGSTSSIRSKYHRALIKIREAHLY
jgi:RNA polymerase sigma factor (sigma-70 family)